MPTTVMQLSKQDFVNLLIEQYGYDLELLESVISVINRWLERGDKAAVYENHDLGHPDLGQVQVLSFGSPQAQLEVETSDELPERLPDIGGNINWRYLLKSTYEGEAL